MSKLLAFACRDAKLNTYMNPLFFQHAGQAMRAWTEVCNDPQTMPAKYPEDFALYQIGTFDAEKGEFTTQTASLLATAADVKQKPAT